MSATQSGPAPRTTAVSNAWVALIGLSFVAFVVGAAVQLGLMFLLNDWFGACVQSMGPCPQGTAYTLWQSMLVTVPTYLIWITPALLAVRRGRSLVAEGVPAGRGLVVGGAALVTLVTAAAAWMWWIPGI